ncbi:MAG: sigma-70 family RNA polymerase sigma factor [Bacteroidota bacterium]
MNRPHLATDQELIAQYLKGKEFALERLIHRHKDKVYTAINMTLRDSVLAEDIFQNTFIKVIDNLRAGNYDEQGKFLPWVLRIAHNLCLDYFRKVKRSPKVVNNDGQDIFNVLKFSEMGADSKLEYQQFAKNLRALVDELPEEQREVVVMRHYLNFSFKEIAEMTGVSINTSLGRMRYGLLKLRKLIEEKQIQF